jgi:hypothetical protein
MKIKYKKKKDKIKVIVNSTLIVNSYYNNQPPNNNKRQSRIKQILNFFPYIITWVYKFVLSDNNILIDILKNIFS